MVSVLAAACGGGASPGQSVEGVETPTQTAGGDAVPPIETERKTLFVQGNVAPMDFRPGSRDLVQAVERLGLSDEGLLVVALKTTDDASGVFLLEDAPDMDWGSLLTQGQPEIFRTFHQNPGLGRWLILVTDVVVHRLDDPIPPTGYRWARTDVDAYAKCGMPADPADECRREFFRSATTVVLQAPGGPPRGR
jgi:hypothetical protein